MDKLLRFLEKLEEYKEIKSAIDDESDDIPYPSEGQKGLWLAEKNLTRSFQRAVIEALTVK